MFFKTTPKPQNQQATPVSTSPKQQNLQAAPVAFDPIYYWVLDNCDIDTDLTTKYKNAAELAVAKSTQEFLFHPNFESVRVCSAAQLKELARVHAFEQPFTNGSLALSYYKANMRGKGEGGEVKPSNKLVRGSGSGSNSGSSGMLHIEDPEEKMVSFIDNYCNTEDDVKKHYRDRDETTRTTALSMFEALKSTDPKFAFFKPYRSDRNDLRISHAIAKRHAIQPFTSKQDVELFINSEPELKGTPKARTTEVLMFSSKATGANFREVLSGVEDMSLSQTSTQAVTGSKTTSPTFDGT